MGYRAKIIVAYLGGPFQGWQRQANGRTVQGVLEKALASMTKRPSPPFVGASRTDSGVHARGQTVHVDIVNDIPVDGLFRGLNAILPQEIRVRSVHKVSSSFHAIRDAKGKLYTYRARWSPSGLPWTDLRSARMERITEMQCFAEALAMLPGHRDMASFTVNDPAQRSTKKTLYRAWMYPARTGLHLHFVGSGFLRYQVRRMVGTLFSVGLGLMTVDEFRDLLDRPRTGAPTPTAKAMGLTLEKVFYRASPLLSEE